MLFGAKQRVHRCRTPAHCVWPKMKESFDYVHSVSIALLLREAAVGNPGTREMTGYVHTAHKMRWILTSCQMYDHIRETHFPQITQTHKDLKNKSNFNKLSFPYHSVPSQQPDVWHVATRKRQPVKNKHHCKYNQYNLFLSLLYLNYLHIFTTLYVDTQHFEMSLFFWNLCECNIYCSLWLFISLLFIHFTCFDNVNICFPCQ